MASEEGCLDWFQKIIFPALFYFLFELLTYSSVTVKRGTL